MNAAGLKVKVVQCLFTDLEAALAATTEDCYEPFLPVIVTIPINHPATKKDGSGKEITVASGDLVTPWQFGIPLPKKWKRAYMVVWDKGGPWKLLEAPKSGEWVPVVKSSQWGFVKTTSCKNSGGGGGNGGGNNGGGNNGGGKNGGGDGGGGTGKGKGGKGHSGDSGSS